MSDEIIKLLDDLGQRFGIAIDWSSENVLPYLQDLMSRYIKYETMTSIMWMVIGVIGLLLGIIFIYKGFKSNDPDGAGLVLIFILVAIACIAIIIFQISDIITVNTIPEKMIYEYLSNSIS